MLKMCKLYSRFYGNCDVKFVYKSCGIFYIDFQGIASIFFQVFVRYVTICMNYCRFWPRPFPALPHIFSNELKTSNLSSLLFPVIKCVEILNSSFLCTVLFM